MARAAISDVSGQKPPPAVHKNSEPFRCWTVVIRSQTSKLRRDILLHNAAGMVPLWAGGESAMAQVEADIKSQMEMVLHDWELYRAGKGDK